MTEKKGIETLCVHGGYKAENGQPQTPPIAMSTTYRYYDVQDVADWFNLDGQYCAYSRLDNPTVGYLEKKYAELEGGTMAIATSAGMSAILISIFNIAGAGDHIIASKSVYGGTYNLFDVTFERMGIECTMIDQDAPAEELLKAAKPNTKAIFAESLGNPSLTVLDFDKFSKIAKKIGVPLIVDNTLASPFLCRPLELGADIVVHSTTKYSDGHANCVGGVVVEKGTFDWAASGKYPGMTEADESYHGLKFYEKYGSVAYSVKLRAQMLRDLGCSMSPMNAFMTCQGLQTLHLRMERHSRNALELAKFLQNHPKVDWVVYPGLEGDKYYDLAQKYMPKGQSGVLSFGVKGGKAAGEKFIDNLELTSLVVHVGDIRTSVLHPASSTHRQMSETDQIAAGIRPSLIRVSVGIEAIKDIIADFDQALNKVKESK
ncbi:MAG: O-acetylhomoserine aminocarboxypropyltransferase/cysteine synthase [Clostridiales bacterium]|nr:O-acetylhomoserine aminocarboxypropyltransferase/cysteine synthase [Clostridiales bacterium]